VANIVKPKIILSLVQRSVSYLTEISPCLLERSIS